MKYFKEKLQAPNATKQQLEREVIDIPAHSMRNNLILYNIEGEKKEEAITMGGPSWSKLHWLYLLNQKL